MIPTVPLYQLLFIGTGLLLVVLIIWLIRLEIRMNKLVRGKQASSLESTIHELIQATDTLEHKVQQGALDRKMLHQHLAQSLRGIHTIRFNPYGSDGSGKQSFATALVDEHGDGVVISSLYVREQCRIFAKPIKGLSSPYELSREEQQALTEASQRIEKE